MNYLSAPRWIAIAILLFSRTTFGAQLPADTIYTGGTILTINDLQPRAEAVAVRDGLIVAVGSLDSMSELRNSETNEFDLEGRAMLPGFVDSHGHAVMGGLQGLSANLLAPPDGDNSDIPTLLSTLSEWVSDNKVLIDQVNLIVGFGYDESQLAEKRPPTRYELDEVSNSVPIIIVHQSGHFGVANSKALEVSGIRSGSKAPPGGVIRVDESGEPTGVLEENAFFGVLLPLITKLGPEGMKAFAEKRSPNWTGR